MNSKAIRYLAALVLLLPISVFNSTSATEIINPPTPIVELPIRIIDNRVVVNVGIAHYDLLLVLDTGASSTALFQSNKHDFLDLASEGSSKIIFPALDEVINGSRLHPIPIMLGDHEYQPDRMLRIERRPPVGDRLNFRFDGVLGQDFFERYVVDIEPATLTMRLYYSAKGLGKFFKTKLKLHMKGSAPHIRFRSKMPWETTANFKELLLDTGYSGSIVIWNRSQFNLAAKGHNKKGLRAKNKGIFTRANFKIGRMRFMNTPVFVAPHEPLQAQKRDGLIGANIIIQFRHVIDFAGEQLMLQGTTFRRNSIDGTFYLPNHEDFLVRKFGPDYFAASVYVVN